MFDQSPMMYLKMVQNLWPVQFFEITVKYAYLAVILRNGNCLFFYFFFNFMGLLTHFASPKIFGPLYVPQILVILRKK